MRAWLLVALAGCVRAAPARAPHVTATFGVAAWSSDLFSGAYCARCPGGPTIHAIADSPDQSLAIFVELDAARCGDGDAWSTELWPIGDARISYGRPGGAAIQAVQGEVDVHACGPHHVRVRFDVVFDDGSTAQGTIDTALDPA